MSYTVDMSGHITFSENTNMDSVCETIFNSYSVSFYHDETIYGKYYIDIDSECITYRGDAFRTLLMTLCSNYSIEHGIIEVADSEKSWLFEKMATAIPPASDGGLRLPKAQLCDIIIV